ncbi:MAG: multi-sensor signal transduction histidine kinase [Polaromonas sp.]|nr:multi-sensor signal transduction histidine kinase [Polaromonas sp.]
MGNPSQNFPAGAYWNASLIHSAGPFNPVKIYSPSFSRQGRQKNDSGSSLRANVLLTAGVLIIGLGLTAGSVVWLRDDLHAKAEGQFKRQAEAIDESIRERLKLPFLLLKGAAGVYAASQQVERHEFRAYMESSQIALEYPSLRGVGMVERVSREDLDEFVAQQREQGSPGFAVKTKGSLPELFIIRFIEPLMSYMPALGFDLGAEPVRREAVERAIDSGQSTLSGRIYLVEESGKRPGFLFTFPVYRNGANPVTTAQRREALTGVLVTPAVADEIMAATVVAAQGQAAFALYDGGLAQAGAGAAAGSDLAASAQLLFDSSNASDGEALEASRATRAAPMFELNQPISMGGRALMLRIFSTKKFEASASNLAPLWLGLSGGVLSGALAWVVWLLASGRANAMRLAERMTLDLASERQRLADIVEGTNAGSWVWQVQTGELSLDERWAALLGYDLQGLAPASMESLGQRMHPDDTAVTTAALKAHLRGQSEHFECEVRMRHRDGRWVCLLGRGKVSVWSADGKPQLMSGIHMDISEKQAAQMALRISEENFRHLFDSSLHGILQAMPDGAIQYANPAACRLFGLTQDEIRQRGRAGLVDPDDTRGHIFLAQARMSGESRGEVTMRRGDGSHFECELSLTSYLNQRGEACSNIFLRDVTKRKLAEAEISALNKSLEDKVRQRTSQLEAANKELEAFSYSVAHDLRSPLSSIDGFSHLLEKSVAAQKPERASHYKRRIRAGVRQMGELTDGLLRLAHISRTSLKAESVNLTSIAERVLEACQEREPGRSVKWHVAQGLLAVGDTELLRQVMENLIGNAWKFTAKAAMPEIRVGQLQVSGDEQPTYFVRDNGAGFDMSYVGKLFGTFQRLHSPEEFSGSGIGLATSQRIILRHGGRIWAEGAVGQGATFFFALPACAERQAVLEAEQ